MNVHNDIRNDIRNDGHNDIGNGIGNDRHSDIAKLHPASRPDAGTATAALPLLPGAGQSADRLFSAGRAGACAGAVALISLVAFEAMAVSAAMPAVAAALGGMDAYALAFGGPLAASVLGMVLAGHTCDRHGAAHATAWGLLLFAAGLLLAGLADGMGQLVAGRVVQGLGGGMVGVALYVGMAQVVPPPLHPRLFSLFAAAWVLPGLVGPAIAAWLVQHLGWRAVFLVAAAAVPLAAAALLPPLWRQRRPVAAATSAAVDEAPGRQRVAWAAAAALGALCMNTGAHGSDSASAWWPGWAMAALPLLGLVVAGVAAQRLLPRGSLRARPGLPAVMAVRALLAAAFGTAEAFVPLALVHTQQWTLTQAGLALSAGAVCWSAGSWVQTRLQLPRHRQLGLAAGLALVGTGSAALAVVLQTGLPGALAVAAWSLAGFGIGLAFPMLSVLTLALSAPAEQGSNSSALQLGDALASSAALALAGLLFTLFGGTGGGANGNASSGDAFAAVLGLAAVLAGVGACLARRAFAGAPSSAA